MQTLQPQRFFDYFLFKSGIFLQEERERREQKIEKMEERERGFANLEEKIMETGGGKGIGGRKEQ